MSKSVVGFLFDLMELGDGYTSAGHASNTMLKIQQHLENLQLCDVFLNGMLYMIAKVVLLIYC